jgi:hypothetical protein
VRFDGGVTLDRVFLTGITHEVPAGSESIRATATTTITLAQAVDNQFTGPGDSFDTDASVLFSLIEVRSTTDLPGTGPYNLVAGVVYEVIGAVSVASSIDANGSGEYTLRGRGGKLTRTGAGVLIRQVASDGLTVEDLELESTGANGDVIQANSPAAGGTATYRNCRITADSIGIEVAQVALTTVIDGCQIEVIGSGANPNCCVQNNGGVLGDLVVTDCLLKLNAANASNGIRLGAVGTGNVLINGNVVDQASAAANAGVRDVGGVSAGRLNGNAFLNVGAGSDLVGVAGPTWAARGNIGPTAYPDF